MSRRSRLEQFVEDRRPAMRRTSAAVANVVGRFRRSISADAAAAPRNQQRVAELGNRLITAVQEQDRPTVQRLMNDKDCDPGFEDSLGKTPLHYAARSGDMESVQSLCRVQGLVDVNAADLAYMTPYMEAQQAGHNDVCDYLQSHGAFSSEKYIKKSGAEHQHHQKSRSVTRRRQRSVSPARSKDSFDNGMETGDVVDHSVLKKVAFAAVLPFVVLLLMQGSWFLVCFTAASTAWFAVVIAFLVTELSIRPPWYHPHPGQKELSSFGLPPYWQGIYTNPKYDLDLDYEDVTFTSDGYTLRGWWIPNTSDRCIVFVHGGGRDRRAWLRHVEMFHRETGYCCLLFDLREHGSSDGAGRGFTYGVKEMNDVRSAAAWVRREKGMKKVAVVGTSVGGSSVLLASAGCDEIDCVISENPITHASALQDHHLGVAVKTYLGSGRGTTLIFHTFAKLAAYILRLRIGFFSSEAIDVIGELNKPVLLMHGTGDEVVPHHHSEELFAKAKEPKELWMAPDAFHCGLYNRYPEEFQERTLRFLSRYLDSD